MMKDTMKNLLTRPHRRFLASRTIAAATLVVVTGAAFAHAALKGVGEGESTFLAVGPAGLKIQGSGKGVTASESDGKVTVKAPVNNLKTGISLRDEHLKKAINAGSHPHASFTVTRSSLKFPERGKSLESSGSGSFTLNGVSQTVSFKYKAENKGDFYEVQGATEFDITKFKIEQPCYLGVCVEKEVKVKVKFKVKD